MYRFMQTGRAARISGVGSVRSNIKMSIRYHSRIYLIKTRDTGARFFFQLLVNEFVELS